MLSARIEAYGVVLPFLAWGWETAGQTRLQEFTAEPLPGIHFQVQIHLGTVVELTDPLGVALFPLILGVYLVIDGRRESRKAVASVLAHNIGLHRTSSRVGHVNDGVSAGGKWMMFQSEDKMTAAKRVRFELRAENYFKEDPDYRPRVELVCENGKFKVATFNPAVRVPPNRPGFWGQPQLEAEVRVDDVHYFKGWNWRGRFLQMDKGTARGMIGAHVFNIAIPTRSGRQIAEFDPVGLNIDPVRTACEITPKKPSKD